MTPPLFHLLRFHADADKKMDIVVRRRQDAPPHACRLMDEEVLIYIAAADAACAHVSLPWRARPAVAFVWCAANLLNKIPPRLA